MSQSLADIRKALKLNQSQMGGLMGMTQGHYSDIERGGRGRRPTHIHWACVRLIVRCDDCGILQSVLDEFP